MSTNPVALELNVIAPSRQMVKIKSTLHDDEPRLYELYWQSELSMEDIARLQTLTQDMEHLAAMLHQREPFTAEDGQKFDMWLREAFGIIFATELEPEVFAEMGYVAKWRVVHFFGLNCIDQPQELQDMIQAALEKEAAMKTPPKKNRKRTGAK